jgi:tripartite-type tricarboxylate transporter receptor subunit TctC
MYAAIVAATAIGTGVSPAAAQSYPSRAVAIVVPYAAGGPVDQLARILAPKLSEKFKQPFVVENVAAGATLPGTGRVARSAPDGHTLLLHNSQVAINVGLYPRAPFDLERDLTPVAFINQNPLVLVGRSTLPANTLPELISWMKGNVTKAAHPGVGSSAHLAIAMFAKAAGVAPDYIPYRGAAPALTDVIAGHSDLYFSTPQVVVETVRAGKLKAYGSTAHSRMKNFPNAMSIPTETSWGKAIDLLYWHAMFAPSGTPAAIIERLNAAIREITSDPAVIAEWAQMDMVPYIGNDASVDGASRLLKKELSVWQKALKESDIEPLP